jgi:guanylate kinase
MLLILCGPSGSGKTTIKEDLVKAGLVYPLITTTTRSPRPGEVDGVHYFFRPFKDEVNSIDRAIAISRINKSNFIEHSIIDDKGSPNFYGLSKSEFNRCFDLHRNFVVVTDIHGVMSIKMKATFPTLSVFIDVPYEELVERITSTREEDSRIAFLKEQKRVARYCDFTLWNNNGNYQNVLNNITSLIKSTVRDNVQGELLI